jgi:hypothetical protein
MLSNISNSSHQSPTQVKKQLPNTFSLFEPDKNCSAIKEYKLNTIGDLPTLPASFRSIWDSNGLKQTIANY